MIWQAALFALVALIYASVGFGGGSTYTALLGLWGVDFKLIPVISLLCNIVVVSGGTARFVRAGLVDWRAVLPLLLVSAPLAFLGGLVPLKQTIFLLILGTALMASCIALIVQPENWKPRKLSQPALLGLSAIVGLIAGLSGIGGGIFMAPVLHLVRWADGKRIAAFASIYILINSLTGVAGQLLKNGPTAMVQPLSGYWPLLLAVLIGGQLGSLLGLRFFSPRLLRTMTALLVGYVAVRLLWQAIGML
jgi:uncharacterized membrane protein YfcA